MSYPTFGKRQSASATGMERRQSSRRKTSVDGKIILGSRKSLKCAIVDMSNTGALLAVASMKESPRRLSSRTMRPQARRSRGPPGKTRIAVTFD